MQPRVRFVPLLILLLTLLLTATGCASLIGYGIGHAVDNSNESYEYVDHAYAHTIKVDSRLLILMNNGQEFRATLLDANPGKSILVDNHWDHTVKGPQRIPLDDIKSILVIHVPDAGRHKYTAIGVVLDIFGAVILYLAHSLADSNPSLIYGS